MLNIIVGWGFSEIPFEGLEFVFVEEFECFGTKLGADFHILRGECSQVNVCFDGDQETAHFNMVSGRLEQFLLLRLEFVQIGVDAVHGTEFAEQFLRPHFSHSLDSRHIV